MKHELFFGPYRSFPCAVGQRIWDMRFGEYLTVGHIHQCPIGKWPAAVQRRGTLILCGDLIKAVRKETSLAVQHWWDIPERLVSQLRKALFVPRINHGARLASAKENAPVEADPAEALADLFSTPLNPFIALAGRRGVSLTPKRELPAYPFTPAELRAARASRKVSRQLLSTLARIQLQWIKDFEHGRMTIPSREMVERIFLVLPRLRKCNPDWFNQ